MALTRHNPNGLHDGMVVRKVSAPSKAFRVSGDPDAGRATYVALSKGERTVLNGNARNYRPETGDEAADRQGAAVGERTVSNGNARSYRPETGDEAADRQGAAVGDEAADDEAADDEVADDVVDEPQPAERGLRSVPALPEPDPEPDLVIAELCAVVQEAVAAIEDGRCSASEAAAIVKAAADLNWAVSGYDS